MSRMRSISVKASAIALAVIGMSLIVTTVVLAANLGFTAELKPNPPVFDGTDTTFTYEICPTGDQTSGLSHWLLEFCDADALALVVTCDPADCELGLDPTTGYVGVKWSFDPALGEEGAEECEFFSFTLPGDWTDVTATGWVAKTKTDYGVEAVLGPNLDCPSAVALATLGASSGGPNVVLLVGMGLAGLAMLVGSSLLLVKRRASL